MIQGLQSHGLSVIWKIIKDRVAKELLDEFSEIFSSQQDPSFTGLISYGSEIDITELDVFLNGLIESRHQQYHAQRQSFFSRYKDSNPFIQHEFDKEYGLMILDAHRKR